MIRLWCTGIFNWDRIPVCVWKGQLMDASENDWMRQIVSLLWWRGRRRRLQTAEQSSIFIVFVNKDSVNYADKLQRGWGLLGDLSVTSSSDTSYFSTTSWHIFIQHLCTLSSSPPPPFPAGSLCRLWVMGTDGRQLLAVSLGPSTLLSPPPLVSGNWWLGCRDSPRIAIQPLSLCKLRGYGWREGEGGCGMRCWGRFERGD